MLTGSGSFIIKRAAGLFLLVLSMTCPARAVQPGQPAPAFSVQAGQRTISAQDMLGRVAIISCETKGTAETNRPFKSAVLRRWRQADSQALAIVPVINCSSFFGFTRSICADRVAAASKKEDLIIYTDLSGALFRDFKIPDDQSTIIIVDKKGIVRFRHDGALDKNGVGQAVRLVEMLLRE